MHHQKLEHYRKNKLNETSISELQEQMEAGQISAEELVLMYTENISLLNKDLRAILEINPDALQAAQALDFERKHKGPRTPLHGIPLLVKDNMDTGDKMHTSAGSLAMQHHYASKDAEVVKKLRAAGAIILGKTNMTEWANFMSDRMTNGYSSRGGQVKNPYGKFDVGGSSSGSAAAVAANMAAAAVGTETSGSIINPAAQNSLVGIKPTLGLVSRTGIIPLSHTQDTAGPLARTVQDAVAVFKAIIGSDEEDVITAMAEKFSGYDWSSHFKKDGLSGARFGIDPTLYKEIGDEQAAAFEAALKKLRESGAEIKEIDIGADQEDLGFAVLLHEFKADLNAYLARSNTDQPIRSMSDVIAFNNKHPELMLKFGQNLLESAEALSGQLTEREYMEALERNRFLAAEQGMNATLQEAAVDALVLPQDFGCNIGAAAGFPSITVPYGKTEKGEPFGVTFAGLAFSEPKLIEYAYAFEQATKGRCLP